MKTTIFDFVYSMVTMGLLMVTTLFIVVYLVVPVSSQLLGEYHVVADALMLLFFYGLLSGAFLRMLLAIRPLRPGNYSMENPHFAYWKLYTVIYEFGRGALLPFTTVFAKPLIAKLFGARIGKNVAIGAGIADLPLVSIGADSVLGHNASITAHAITSGRIMLSEVRIGSGVTVGVNAVIWPGVEIGDGAIVAAGSVVSMNTRIPSGELWGGIPARKIKDVEPSEVRG